MLKMKICGLLVKLMVFGIGIASHIDEDDKELMNFEFDKVVFKLRKDCSLDKSPEVKDFLDHESVKYPKLDVFLSDGDPRFELMKDGKVVDTIRVFRYNLEGLKKLVSDLGYSRDESYTWEKKKAIYDLERAFKTSTKLKPDL